MAVFAVTNTFASLTTITASAHNTNWSDVTTWLNNRYNGTDTWNFVKVSGTDANPMDVTSSGATTELSINNTATDGDPLLSFKLSGSQTHGIGVDDSDSDALVGGTTAITTNQWLRVPSTGAQAQFNAGTVSIPGVSFIGDSNTGFYSLAADQIGTTLGGTERLSITPSALIVASTQISNQSGSVTAPSYSFTNDLNLGIYRKSADVLGFVTSGVERMTVSDSLVTSIADFAVSALSKIYLDGGGDTFFDEASANVARLRAGGEDVLQGDNSTTATQTRLMIYDVDNAQLERVTVGAADSGGAGFKVLRIPN